MRKILPGDLVEVTMHLGRVDEKRIKAKVHRVTHPRTVWITLPDGNVIRRHLIKHEVVRVEKGAQKAPDKPSEPQVPEDRKEVEKNPLDDMFNDLLTS